jgi:hypothetical protein
MATGTDSDEKDLESLGEVTLNFFKAEPPIEKRRRDL